MHKENEWICIHIQYTPDRWAPSERPRPLTQLDTGRQQNKLQTQHWHTTTLQFTRQTDLFTPRTNTCVSVSVHLMDASLVFCTILVSTSRWEKCLSAAKCATVFTSYLLIMFACCWAGIATSPEGGDSVSCWLSTAGSWKTDQLLPAGLENTDDSETKPLNLSVGLKILYTQLLSRYPKYKYEIQMNSQLYLHYVLISLIYSNNSNCYFMKHRGLYSAKTCSKHPTYTLHRSPSEEI